jgi:hypothetical protein
VCEQRLKNHKKIIQTIMASTRSSDCVAIGGSSDGIGGGVLGQLALPMLSGLKHFRKKRVVWVLIIEKL